MVFLWGISKDGPAEIEFCARPIYILYAYNSAAGSLRELSDTHLFYPLISEPCICNEPKRCESWRSLLKKYES